jgi:hypothetical protein
MKYQFCIRFNNIDVNSASSKAVLDCNKIFSACGYKDYTFTIGDNSKKVRYYFLLLKELLVFFFSVRRGSVVGIQYPLLSINNVFKYFIRLTKIKGVKFFCIIHDLESLRTGGKDIEQITQEIINLNCYDSIIVHNDAMMAWLKAAGVNKDMISLKLFDYLSGYAETEHNVNVTGPIVYAGNLRKSTFVYDLPRIKTKVFTLYGPGFDFNNASERNLTWVGEYSPDEISGKLSGSFGLIWDGSSIEACDEVLGNYLKYNNPHKFSLYLAAGLPVIAPVDSAIGQFIREHNIGALINNLHDLENLQIDKISYETLLKNVSGIREKVINGYYFTAAIQSAENSLIN